MNNELEMEQTHYTEIANAIDSYTDTDRAFILWYLLQEYDRLSGMEEVSEEPKTVSDYAVSVMSLRHHKIAEEMRDVLFYAIW